MDILFSEHCRVHPASLYIKQKCLSVCLSSHHIWRVGADEEDGKGGQERGGAMGRGDYYDGMPGSIGTI